MSNDVLKNLKEISNQIAKLEEQFTRKIYLVGATKTRTVEEINFAVENGLEIVGENKPQEFRDKLPYISPLAKKHFIGHLQSNKLKYVVGKADLIHSCDSLITAEGINVLAQKQGVVQDVLIEIKISDEEHKHGFLIEEIFDVVDKLKSLKNIRFMGLMTVLPIEKTLVVGCCKKMKEAFIKMQSIFGEDFIYLSMGMSEDYVTAIENGANMIRLGRAIFGERRT